MKAKNDEGETALMLVAEGGHDETAPTKAVFPIEGSCRAKSRWRSAPANRPARQEIRERIPGENSLWGIPILRRKLEDSLGGALNHEEKKRMPRLGSQRASVQVRVEIYFFQRLLTTTRMPDSKVNALMPEPASISGATAGLAMAAPDIPITSNIIPTIFMYSPPTW